MACTSWSSRRGDARPITGVLPFLTFLSLTLSKGLFTSNILSKIVGPISRFFFIRFFPKMEKYWAVPPSNTYAVFYIQLIYIDVNKFDLLLVGSCRCL